MANHKRRRPKHQRNGCLMCKPHKDERTAKRVRYKGLKAARIKRELPKYDEYSWYNPVS